MRSTVVKNLLYSRGLDKGKIRLKITSNIGWNLQKILVGSYEKQVVYLFYYYGVFYRRDDTKRETVGWST